jgi:hypothetical protein
MAPKIQHKRSAVAGKAPLPADLEYGEIAVNYEASDPALYVKDSANAVRKIGTQPDATASVKGIVQLADAAAVTAGTAGRVVDAAQLKAVSDAATAADDWTRTGTTLSPTNAGDLISSTDGSRTALLGTDGAAPYLGTGGSPYPFLFKVGDGTVDVERARLTETGNFLVGGTPAAPNLQLKADGGIVANTNGLVYDAAQKRLGLGTSTPSELLTLNNNNTSGTAIRIENTSSGGYNWGIYSVGSAAGLAPVGSLAFRDSTNGATRLVIDSSGRVGIGTTSPGQLLELNGASNPCLLIKDTTNNVIAYTFADDNVANFGSASAHPVVFRINNNEAARIDASSRLLVGTSSARSAANTSTNAQLQVETAGTYAAQSITTNQANANAAYLCFVKSRGSTAGSNTAVNTNDYLGYISFDGTDGTSPISAAAIYVQVDGTPGANDMPGRLVFSTTADGASSPTERLRITSVGEVCIGTTSAHAANRNALENATTGQLTFRHSSATAGRHNIVGMTLGGAFVVADNTGLTGVQLTYSGTSWSTLSDERFKTDLEPIESGLSKVATLRALTGRLITDPEDKRRSFLIAQDVDAVLPEAVDKTDPEALALSYTEVVPLLVAALKESKERIEALEAKVAALESA